MEKNKANLVCMSRKKLALRVVLIAILTLFARHVIEDYYTTFKFSRFDSSEELKSYLDNKFPVGSDAIELVSFLANAGAECKSINIPKESHKKYSSANFDFDNWFSCLHTRWELSGYLKKEYDVLIYSDSSNKIIKIHPMIIKGLK
jgi:hypothetical protein